MEKVDVFISRKSADAAYAKKIYDYLIAQGLSVFVSDQSLREIGNADYIKAIDDALARATHLIVVGSSAENITSPWVEAEWLFFLNRKRSGKASGNLFTVIIHPLKLEELPASLANYEVIPYNTDNFPIIYNYVRESGKPSVKAPVKPLPAERQRAWLMITVLLLVIGYVGFYFYFSSQPYDATVFLEKRADLDLPASYPPFNGGEISIIIDNKEERKQVMANGEVILKQLPSVSKGKKATIKLLTNYWRIAEESVTLGKTVHLAIIPDGSLGNIIGNVRTPSGNPLADVHIQLDNDTSIYSDGQGYFQINLPYRMQKEYYVLHLSKDGYKPINEYYYPKSGRIDVVLKGSDPGSTQNDALINGLSPMIDSKTIIDNYSGTIGEKNFTLSIENVNGTEISGYNITGTNRRPIKGRIVNKRIETTDSGYGSTIFQLVLAEPGDDKWDGEFNIDLTISGKSKGGFGNWKSFNGNLTRDIKIRVMQ